MSQGEQWCLQPSDGSGRPFMPRRSVPWHYPDDMPWLAARQFPVTPVIAAGDALSRTLFPDMTAGCSARGEGSEPCGLARLVRLYRNLGLEPLVLADGLFLSEARGRARVELREALSLGVRVSLLPPSQSLWSVLARLVSGPCLLHPAEAALARRSGLVLLLQEAAERHLERETAPLRDSLRPAAGSARGWPVLLGKATVAALAEGSLPSKLDAIPAFDNADELCAEILPGVLRMRDMPDGTWLPAMSALRLLELVHVPDRGIRHAEAVAAVAAALAQRGLLCGMDVNPELARAAGLVHDIAKGNARHETVGGLWLESLGLSAMARCVRDHRDLVLAGKKAVTERELVYLADKYCFGARFVPLAERFGQKKELYRTQARAVAGIEKRLGHARALEARLTGEIGCSPERIASLTLTGR
ncbi:MAG: HD domain-containing protein [Desulfovibrionaceae bacterium]|nr:HD domain-containing protein [Desulfovibrionaceae bacterium]